jgi:hypothetical protein
MSQNGTIVSVAQYVAAGVGGNWNSGTASDGASWVVQYSYQLDAGGIGQAQVIVGNGAYAAHATAPLWASPTSTITVSGPGSSNPVVLSCPKLIATAAFGA